MPIVDLHAEISGSGKPILVLHGMFGSVSNWGGVARWLSDDYRVHRLDLRNHGASPWADEMTIPAMAGDVRAYISKNDLASVILIGHSMGGKAAMRLALESPALVERLIVVDIAPAAYPVGWAPGYIAAMKAADLAVERREDVEDQLVSAIADDSMRGFLMQNLVRDGKSFRWRLNLDALAAEMEKCADWPEIDAHYDGPVTFIKGETSPFLRERNFARIDSLFPNNSVKSVIGAGHLPHTEQPILFAAALKLALLS